MIFGKIQQYWQLNSNNQPPFRFLIVSLNTSTGANKQLIKYDLNGVEVTSRTYTQMGAVASRRAIEIYQAPDTDKYFARGSTQIMKLDTNLLIEATGSFTTEDLYIPGPSIPNFVFATTTAVGFISKTTMGSVGTNLVLPSGNKRIRAFSAPNERPDLFVSSPITTANGQKRIRSNTTFDGFTTTYEYTTGNSQHQILIYPNINSGDSYDGGTFFTFEAQGGSGRRVRDGVQFQIYVTEPQVGNTRSTKYTSQFKNSDILYWDGSDLFRRTLSALSDNQDINVWTVGLLQTPFYMAIDDNDNVYVITNASSGTGAIRKYNSAGTLVFANNTPGSAVPAGAGLVYT